MFQRFPHSLPFFSLKYFFLLIYLTWPGLPHTIVIITFIGVFTPPYPVAPFLSPVGDTLPSFSINTFPIAPLTCWSSRPVCWHLERHSLVSQLLLSFCLCGITPFSCFLDTLQILLLSSLHFSPFSFLKASICSILSVLWAIWQFSASPFHLGLQSDSREKNHLYELGSSFIPEKKNILLKYTPAWYPIIISITMHGYFSNPKHPKSNLR